MQFLHADLQNGILVRGQQSPAPYILPPVYEGQSIAFQADALQPTGTPGSPYAAQVITSFSLALNLFGAPSGSAIVSSGIVIAGNGLSVTGTLNIPVGYVAPAGARYARAIYILDLTTAGGGEIHIETPCVVTVPGFTIQPPLTFENFQGPPGPLAPGAVTVDPVSNVLTNPSPLNFALANPQFGTFSAGTLPYAGNYVVDMLGAAEQSMLLTGNVNLATTDKAPGRRVTVRLTASGADRTVGYPSGGNAWTVFGFALPATIPSGKTLRLVLNATGTTESSVEVTGAFVSGVVPASAGGGAVASVNGQTGSVVLAASDVGADASGAASSAQAYAIQRAHHTGTQVLATISDAGNAAGKNVGTTASTVAAGDDARIVGALPAATAASTYAPLASPALAGTPTAPTASVGTNSTQIATTAFVAALVSTLTSGAPGTLDTFLEAYNRFLADESAAAALTATVAGKLTASSNLSDLASAATARTNLGLGNAINAISRDPATGNLVLPAGTTLVAQSGQTIDLSGCSLALPYDLGLQFFSGDGIYADGPNFVWNDGGVHFGYSGNYIQGLALGGTVDATGALFYADLSNCINVPSPAGLLLNYGGFSGGLATLYSVATAVENDGDLWVGSGSDTNPTAGTQLLSGLNTLGPLNGDELRFFGGQTLAEVFNGFTANSAYVAQYSSSSFNDFFHGNGGYNTDTSLPGDGTFSFMNGNFTGDGTNISVPTMATGDPHVAGQLYQDAVTHAVFISQG